MDGSLIRKRPISVEIGAGPLYMGLKPGFFRWPSSVLSRPFQAFRDVSRAAADGQKTAYEAIRAQRASKNRFHAMAGKTTGACFPNRYFGSRTIHFPPLQTISPLKNRPILLAEAGPEAETPQKDPSSR